jgi:hypothetical protein
VRVAGDTVTMDMEGGERIMRVVAGGDQGHAEVFRVTR